MPTEDAYSSGHLVLSHLGTCMCSNVETNLSWTCLVSGLLNFEHPSVLLFCICLLPGVLWLWNFLYSVGPHPVSSLHIYTFVVSRAFMAGASSQAGDADSSRAPGLTSGLQGSMNAQRGALLLMPQLRCISSFVFYIFVTLVPYDVWSW